MKTFLILILITVLTLVGCVTLDKVADTLKSKLYAYTLHNYTQYKLESTKWYVLPKTVTYRYGRTIAMDYAQCIKYRNTKTYKYVKMVIVKNDKERFSWTAKGLRK